MTETRRLYYEDVYKKEFTATVVECREQKKGYAVVLDESAFYPEGGGQPSDVGTLGDAKVTEVHEKDGRNYRKTYSFYTGRSGANAAEDGEV